MAANIQTDDDGSISLPHPSQVLKSEFMKPMGPSAYALAKPSGVSRDRTSAAVHGRQVIDATIANWLGTFVGVDPQWFVNMQSRYDLR